MLRSVSTACLVAAMTVAVGAQDQVVKPVPAGASVTTTRLSTLMNAKILIQDDQAAGMVTDIVLSDSGCVDYVVATYNNQYYVIPYSAVTFRKADRIVYIDIAPTQFKRVTFFTGNNWPDFYATTYQQTVFNIFGVTNIRHDGPRSTLKPNLDQDRDRGRNQDDDRRGIKETVKDKIKDKASGKGDGVKLPNPGVIDPPQTDLDAKNPLKPGSTKPEAPKLDSVKPTPKADLPKVDAPKPSSPKVELPKAPIPKVEAPKPVTPPTPAAKP